MSYRRGHASNSGMIRPRQFTTNYSKDRRSLLQSLPKKQLLLILVVACTVFITTFLFNQSTYSQSVSAPTTGRLRATEEDGGLTSEGVEEEEEVEVDSEDDVDEAEEDSDAAEDVEEEEEEEPEQDETEEEREVPVVEERAPGNKLRLSLTSYFHNLNKRQASIESSGSFKYVLVDARDYLGRTSLLVQGCSAHLGKKCKHPDAAKALSDQLQVYDIESTVLGGGRITWHGLKKPKKKLGVISIFGYSKTFGACDECNQKACEIVAKQYPDFIVRFSNEGYTEKDEYKIKEFIKCST